MSVLPFDSFANSSEPSVLVARMKAGGAVVLHTMSTAKEALQAVEWTVVDAVWPIPLIAAGGIADGSGLALGASGAWIGTEAMEDDSAYLEELFDIGWPKAPHRVLRNNTVAN